MRALVKSGPGSGLLDVQEVAEPVPAEDEVIVKVSGCGICGTDLSLYQGSPDLIRQFRPTFPITIGHEFAGQVVRAGTSVTAISLGDWVTVNPHLFCGRCSACHVGYEEICEDRPLISWDRPGGAAEYVAVRASNAYPLPAEIAA